MFTAALFTTAKTWKQPKCPLTEEWVKRMQYMNIYRGILLGHKKKNEIMSFAATWMDPEIIILSEVHQTKMKVAQSCLTLCDPMDYTQSMNSPGQNTGVGSLSFLQGIFPTQESNLGLLHCRQILTS